MTFFEGDQSLGFFTYFKFHDNFEEVKKAKVTSGYFFKFSMGSVQTKITYECPDKIHAIHA